VARGIGSTKRRQELSKRAARLKSQGFTLSEISTMTGIPRDKVNMRVKLGERLLSLE
jgi:orotate phosphoribosyltransferase-like protein